MIDGKDAAFPVHADTISRTGLTKREYFAAKAMQALLSTLSPGLYDNNTLATYAYEAVKSADYLLEELSNP